MLTIISLGITYILRWAFVILAAYIVISCTYSLFLTKDNPETWGFFNVIDGDRIPITHCENVIGRNKSADIQFDSETVSKNHALLVRKVANKWLLKNLSKNNQVTVNGEPINTTIINKDDSITIGDIVGFIEDAPAGKADKIKRISLFPTVTAITIFQVCTIIQLLIGTDCKVLELFPFVVLSVVMWIYVAFCSYRKIQGFELELMAFFMTTINFAVIASSEPYRLKTELFSVLIGIGLMIFMCMYMRDIDRARKIKPLLIVLSILAMLINVIFGVSKNGAANWLEFGSVSVQPSEMVKVAFLFIGAESLDKLYDQKNTLTYAIFSFFCIACLAFISDFGTAAIFLATYLIVSFLRSGDFSRMILTTAGLGAVVLLIIKIKPYIASRFAAWRHVWEPDFVNNGGYQQTRTMSFGAGGGLLGLGAGNGSLKTLEASNTDLVFGFVMEEWGLIIALLLVSCLVVVSIFALSHIMSGRSTFYTILACSTVTMLLIQTMLNIFGSVDILPLTGVTFPFVSAGGSSMIASWAMLAYLKVSDMRPGASLAVKWRK